MANNTTTTTTTVASSNDDESIKKNSGDDMDVTNNGGDIATASTYPNDGSISQVSYGASEISTDSQGNAKKLSALGSSIRKCARELQSEDPPVNEKRCLTILQHLLNIVKDHTMNTTQSALQQNVSNIKNDLKTNQELAKAAIVKYGALEAILCGMKSFSNNANIQSRGVTILGLVASEPDYQNAIADVYGASSILGMLVNNRDNRKNPTLCAETCSALSQLCYNSQRNVLQFTEGDGITALRSIIHYHGSKNPSGLVEYCFDLLTNVAQQQTSGGGGNNGIKKEKSRSSSASVCSTGESSVRSKQSRDSLTNVSVAPMNESYQFLHFIEDAELIEAIITLMGKHKSNKTIVLKGSHLLFVLSTKTTNQRTLNSLVWGKAHLTLIKVMKMFPNNQTLQIESFEALFKLTNGRREAIDGLAEESTTIITTLDVMSKHMKKRQIQEYGCELLGTFVKTHAKIVAKGIKKCGTQGKDTLRCAKERYPQTCTPHVIRIITCYNQMYDPTTKN